jgi:uncharacterized protein (DUF488 family)
MATVYTIGHSTRTIEQHIELLQAHRIGLLIDIRAFPASRRLPHFNREALEQSLPAAGIEYRWMPDLGGHRKRILEDSPNTGLRNESFRNYADYMLTPQFQNAAAEVVRLAGEFAAAGRGGVCIMCAEAVYFRCHRMLVSDYLVAHGHEVLHITDKNPARPHKLLAEAQMIDGQLIYKGLF